MPRRPTMQLQRRPPSPRIVGSFDVRLKNRGWFADAPNWPDAGDGATGDAAGADDAASADDAGAGVADDQNANDGVAAGADGGAASDSDDIALIGVTRILPAAAARSCSMAATRRRLSNRNKMPGAADVSVPGATDVRGPRIWLDNAMKEKAAAAAEETDSDQSVVFNSPVICGDWL